MNVDRVSMYASKKRAERDKNREGNDKSNTRIDVISPGVARRLFAFSMQLRFVIVRFRRCYGPGETRRGVIVINGARFRLVVSRVSNVNSTTRIPGPSMSFIVVLWRWRGRKRDATGVVFLFVLIELFRIDRRITPPRDDYILRYYSVERLLLSQK